MNYFDLGSADAQVVDNQFIDRVNTEVPLGDQAKWQNLVFSVVSLDDLCAKVSSVLRLEVKAPAGTALVLVEAAAIWVPRPLGGHDVWNNAMLQDAGTTAPRHWTFDASHMSSIFTARMGLVYQCLHARMP
jgi:hypothetical protein